jgi:hypothetical protein
MKKLTFLTLAAALAFVAAPAFAAQPFAPNNNSKSQGSAVGEASSDFIKNGGVVSDSAQAGTRSDTVQSLLGH